jgi:hypothetical protein
VRALGMGFCVVELNNKNEMSISSLFMLLIWLCCFRVGVTKGLFLLVRVVVILVLDTDQSSHKNNVIYFSYYDLNCWTSFYEIVIMIGGRSCEDDGNWVGKWMDSSSAM